MAGIPTGQGPLAQLLLIMLAVGVADGARNHSEVLSAIGVAVSSLRRDFGASSLFDTYMPELWVHGAANVVPRLYELASMTFGDTPCQARRIALEQYNTTDGTRLAQLYEKYGSDKAEHGYSPMYSTSAQA